MWVLMSPLVYHPRKNLTAVNARVLELRSSFDDGFLKGCIFDVLTIMPTNLEAVKGIMIRSSKDAN